MRKPSRRRRIDSESSYRPVTWVVALFVAAALCWFGLMAWWLS